VPFIPGDAFDPAFLPPTDVPFYAPPTTPAPTLSTVTTLAPLLGHVSAIHASSFFHLFDEEKQAQLAHLLAGLLSPEPGSMLFGAHGGLPEKGLRVEAWRNHERTVPMFCHSPESWNTLWDGEVFEKGTVRVEVELREIVRKDQPGGSTFWFMMWSVARI